MAQTAPLADRVALVTGASRGIGHATALALAEAGAQVIAVARTQGGLEELDDAIAARGLLRPTLVPADMTDYDALDRLGAAIDQRWGRLDLLVANAGMLGGLSPTGHFEPKVFQRVFDVNVTANWRLIRSLDPLLRAAPGGARALFLSSRAARACRPFWGPYSASKAALEALVRTYAAEVESSGVACVLVDPGATRTAMRALAMPGEDPATLPAPETVAAALLRLCIDPLPGTGQLYVVREDRFRPFSPAE